MKVPAWLRGRPVLAVGLSIIGSFCFVALFAPWLAPHPATDPFGENYQRPSATLLLGTNDAGSDNFSRLIWGSRTTLIVVVCATTMVLVIGLAVGLTAGLRGGFADRAAMRVVDVFLGLPILPLLIFIAALAGPSLTVSILMIGLFTWPQTARIVRSQTVTLRQRGFITSARGFGAGPLYVIRRHLVPSLGPIIAANLVFVAGLSVAIEAGLAFLGLGDPVAVSWGSDLNRALTNPQILIDLLWLRWLVPTGLALTLAVVGFTLVGVALEPQFNPRSNRAR